jgi:predicted nucleic acid-binding protein
MYTLDTNAIIYYVKEDPALVLFLEQIFSKQFTVYISTITEIELFGFPGISFIEEKKLEELMLIFGIISVDSKIARIAASLRRNYRLKVSDSAIAATAIFTGTTLVTRNVRDFRKVSDLKIQKI